LEGKKAQASESGIITLSIGAAISFFAPCVTALRWFALPDHSDRKSMLPPKSREYHGNTWYWSHLNFISAAVIECWTDPFCVGKKEQDICQQK
jgi:hypothetical protein